MYSFVFIFMVMCYFTRTFEDGHKHFNFEEHDKLEIQNFTAKGLSCVSLEFSGSYLLPLLELHSQLAGFFT